MMESNGLLHPGDLIAFTAGAAAAAGLGFIRRHELYVRLVSHYPFWVGLDLWMRMHVLRHPENMAEYIVNAVATSTAQTPKGPIGPPR